MLMADGITAIGGPAINAVAGVPVTAPSSRALWSVIRRANPGLNGGRSSILVTIKMMCSSSPFRAMEPSSSSTLTPISSRVTIRSRS